MNYIQWLHQHCPETQHWSAVQTFELIQQAKARRQPRLPQLIMILVWIFCFAVLYGLLSRPALEYVTQDSFWSWELTWLSFLAASFFIFLEQKLQHRFIKKTLLELVKSHVQAKSEG